MGFEKSGAVASVVPMVSDGTLLLSRDSGEEIRIGEREVRIPNIKRTRSSWSGGASAFKESGGGVLARTFSHEKLANEDRGIISP